MATLKIGSVITTPSTAYVVKKILGSGAFGDVALCRKTRSKETVALKVTKVEDNNENAREEKKILKYLKHHGSENHNIVKWFGSFESRGRYCLEFEKLDISLEEFIEQSVCLPIMHIRPILHQLASAMLFLKNAGMIHGDLKPENIMMVDHATSLQVKVIDFGLAHLSSFVKKGITIQTLWYRAPEVLAGANYDESADIWSLGCIVVEMLFGSPLFPAKCTSDMMRHIVKTIGTPPDHMLQNGMHSSNYFKLCNIRGQCVWRLKSPLSVHRCCERRLSRLDDLYQMDFFHGSDPTIDKALDFEYFVNLVMSMLELDPQKRATPQDILNHPFITMSHIDGVFDTEHVSECVELMRSVVSHPVEEQCIDDEQPSTSTSTNETAKKRTREDETEEGRSHQDRPIYSIQYASGPKRKAAKKSKVVQFTNTSKKRSREDEEDVDVQHRNTQDIKRPKGSPFPNATYQGSPWSGSKKRSRDEDEEAEENIQLRSGCVIKRPKTASIVPDQGDQASSSDNNLRPSTSGFRKRSRDDSDISSSILTKKLKPTPPPATDKETTTTRPSLRRR